MAFLQSIRALFNRRQPAEVPARSEQPDIFQYVVDGVEITLSDEVCLIRWTDIERIVVYKEDLFTQDEVCMDISCANRSVMLTESVPGWNGFLQRLAVALPGIDPAWESRVTAIPFDHSLETIYERADRKMPASTNFYATIPGTDTAPVLALLQRSGWSVRKESLQGWMAANSWSELILEPAMGELLLNGLVAYHPDNVAALAGLLRQCGGGASGEFYGEDKELVETIGGG